MAKKRRKSGERFRLVIYERMWKRWAFPSILIIPASIALWWFAPLLSITNDLYRALAFIPALIALFLLVFTFLSRSRAWVQCRANHLRIQTPLYPLVISYGRIKEVLPRPFSQVFDPSKEKSARRNWLSPYWGQTALVIKVSKYPIRKAWLRLWFSNYLLSSDTPGFVFLVDDWMALSRQVDDFRTTWGRHRAKKRQEKLADRTW
ncbi:MAG: hypothetical protein GY832_07400 [Chloroflexi bacterium]|nr:hypothetical protein [Chloroflexota bacterium]